MMNLSHVNKRKANLLVNCLFHILSCSSSRCQGVVCGLWLWYFLIILTYYFWWPVQSLLSVNCLQKTCRWSVFSVNQLCSQNAENIAHIKGKLLDQAATLLIASLFIMGTSLKQKQSFCSIAPLFKIGTSLKGKNSLPEGVNSFL